MAGHSACTTGRQFLGESILNVQEHILRIGTKVTGGVGKLPTPDLRSDEESLAKTTAIILFHNLNTCFVTITGKRGDWKKKEKKNLLSDFLCLLSSP